MTVGKRQHLAPAPGAALFPAAATSPPSGGVMCPVPCAAPPLPPP